MSRDTGTVDVSARNGAAVLAMIGSALVIIGTFVTWVSVTVQGYEGTTSPQSGIDWDGSTAAWMIGLAAIAALTALGEITGWRILPSWVGRSVIVDGVILAFLAGTTMSDASKSGTINYAGQALHYQRHIGAGLWLCMIGAIVVIIAGYTLSGGVGGLLTARKTYKQAQRTQEELSDPPPSVPS